MINQKVKEILSNILFVVEVMGGIFLAFLIIGIISLYFMFAKYSTTDIADYGKYKGNSDNKTATQFITSFFPEKIEDYFEDVTYSYKAQKNDAVGCEAYLEFTIKDSETYSDFIQNATSGFEKSKFKYDENFTQYEKSNFFELHQHYSSDGELEDSCIDYAVVKKILTDPEKQTVIFWGLCVYDESVQTEFLNTFFNRFDIDVLDYQTHSDKLENSSLSALKKQVLS